MQVLNLGETLDKKLLISSEEGEEASEAAHEDEDSHDSDAKGHDHVHEHGQYDPHIWLDPVLAQECVKLITARLEQMDPEKRPLSENAEQYNQKLSQLDNVLKESLKEVQQSRFIPA